MCDATTLGTDLPVYSRGGGGVGLRDCLRSCAAMHDPAPVGRAIRRMAGFCVSGPERSSRPAKPAKSTTQDDNGHAETGGLRSSQLPVAEARVGAPARRLCRSVTC